MENAERVCTLKNIILPTYFVILGLLAASIIYQIVIVHNYDEFIYQYEEGQTKMYSYLALAQILFRIAGFILFLIWFFNAYKNYQQYNPTYAITTPGMAVGYYFIPFLNLYKPYKTMEEVYAWSSQVSDKVQDTIIVSTWWTLLIMNNIIGRMLFKIDLPPNNVPMIS